MTGRKFRRKVRKRKGAVGNSRMKFGLFFGIIALTVGLGFLTARFAIGPLIGFHAEKSPIQELAERKETAEQQKQTAAAEEEASAKTTADEQTDKGSAGSTAEKTETKSEENGRSTQAGYALQFGAFSSKAAAQSLSDALHEKGIDTKIVELDGVFKVLSPVSEGKTQALAALEKVKEKAVSEVFITEEPA